MIHTPSLRGRVMLTGITLLAVLIGSLDAFVFLSMRDRLEESLVDILDAREQIVHRLDPAGSPEELARQLADSGVPAVVRTADGSVHLSDPPRQSFALAVPGSTADTGKVERRTVLLDGGLSVEVQVPRRGTDQTLQRLLLLEIGGTIGLLVLALAVLRRVSLLITSPVERIVQVADAIARGETDQRLEPSDPTTELGRMALAFDRTVDAMDAALSESRAAQSSSRHFLADAAHQLRTPLAGLRASAESLLRNPDTHEKDTLLANIARESVRASKLVDSLLRVARLDRGEPLTFDELDLLSIVREESSRTLALAPSLTVNIDSTGKDFTIAGDRRALQDAVANLLDNARQHARSTIDLHLEEDLGALELIVEDDGPGVPTGEEDRVFERFVSLEGNGSGLGLSIARAIARSHGGDLTVAGSRFALLVPRANLTS